ncbi:MAG TPA: RidA family protein [Thalassobaculum sp.]
MTRTHVFSGSVFEENIGYARAVVDGDWIFVSGTTGFDYKARTISDDPVEQTRQCLHNIRTAMEEAGFSLDDTVRVHYIYPNPDDFEPCWPLLREAFGVARPAATMLSCALLEPRIKVEIEVTGKRRSA